MGAIVVVQPMDVRFLEYSYQDFQVIEQLCTSHELRADVGHGSILIQSGICVVITAEFCPQSRRAGQRFCKIFQCDVCMNAAIIELCD